MSNNYMQIEFAGFEPEYELRSTIYNIAADLQRSSPSDSRLKVVITKGKGIIKAYCRIASRAGVFFAESISVNPIQAVKKIERNICEQLAFWKNRRKLD